MALRDIIKEIQKLNNADQLRLKDFFIKSLASYSASEPILKEISEQKHKDGYTCTHCHSTNAVRFRKYHIKAGAKIITRQRYRYMDCGKTFTNVTNTPLKGSHLPRKWLDFYPLYYEGYSLWKASELIGVHHVTLFYWRHKVLSALKQMDINHFSGIV